MSRRAASTARTAKWRHVSTLHFAIDLCMQSRYFCESAIRNYAADTIPALAVRADTIILVVAVTVASVLVLIIVFIFSCRHYLYEQKLVRLLWKIEPNELVLLDKHGNVVQIDLKSTEVATQVNVDQRTANAIAMRNRTQSCSSNYRTTHVTSTRTTPFTSPTAARVGCNYIYVHMYLRLHIWVLFLLHPAV